MKSIYSFFFCFVFSLNLSAQNYFQQNVDYKIDAELIPATKMLKVHSVMNYTNNSNDPLNEIYIRLHWNLYSENSYARKLAREQKEYYSQSTKEVNLLAVILKQNEQTIQNKYFLDNTILKLSLVEPLEKGKSLQVEISLEEEIPPEGIRMGYYERNFSIAHWFPAVCVYDKFGWHTDQYLGTGEFYEEIGDYEVNMTLPKSFLVFHTGELINSSEVLSKEILDKLEQSKNSEKAIRIFDPNTKKLVINDDELQTWKIRATNVRTFAFTAFEEYFWDAALWNGILVHTVFPKKFEEYYSDEGIKAALHAIKFYSEKIGPYVYPQMFVTVGGTTGGMEYPGIVFMGRGQGGGVLSKITSSVIMHEIGHNWFPMMLNSNETEFAFQDEGFNSFITNLAMEDIYGRSDNYFNLSGILKTIFYNTDVRTNDQAEIINSQLNGYEEPIMTHSDRYEQTSVYFPNSYAKTSTILFMLQYVMGDEAFDELWKEYYKRFLFKHVYPDDFFNLAQEIYQKHHGRKDLRWFFDQWFTKTYLLDYALKKFEYEEKEGKYLTTISIKRIERALMLVDVVFEFENGEKKQVWFDVEEFMKGPSLVTKTFEFDSKPIRAEINPDRRLLDVNRLNNSSDFLPPIFFHSNPVLDVVQLPFHYRILWMPIFGFNNADGFKLGMNLNGSFIGRRKIFDLNLMQGLKFGKNSFGGDISIGNRLDVFGPLAFGSLTYSNYEGRRGVKLEFNKRFAKIYNRNPQLHFNLIAKYFDAYDDRFFNYQLFDDVVQYYPIVLSDYLYYKEVYRQRKFLSLQGELTFFNNREFFSAVSSLSLEVGLVEENYRQGLAYPDRFEVIYSYVQTLQYQKLTASFLQTITSRKYFSHIKIREYIGVSPKELPKAKSFYLSTVTPIEEFDSPIYRSIGIISRNARINRSIPNGGGYMRGYYNQNIYGDLISTINTEINFGRTLKIIPLVGPVIVAFNPTFFFDAGNVWSNIKQFSFSRFLTDYGFSLSIAPKISVSGQDIFGQFSPLKKLGIEELRFDFPLYVSHPIDGEKKFQFRWLIGFQSSLN